MRRSRRATLAGLAIAAAVLLLGCVEDTAAPTPEPLATRLPIFATAPAAGSTVQPAERLTAAEVTQMLQDLVCWYDSPSLANECLPVGQDEAVLLEQIARSGDQRFVAPLVDMLWIELGWQRWVLEALTAITGETFTTGYDWSVWIESDRPPLPDGYVEWKGRLLSLVDSSYRDLLPNDLDLAVRPDELIWARTAPNERPPLVNPDVVHRIEQRYLNDDDIVFGVFVDGVARAYPQRILAWHELISDEVNGRPLLITNCVPCGGTVAYEAAASDGVRYTFGNSGLVYHSRRLFFDEQTHSLWDQLTGEPVSGPAMDAGVSLTPTLMLRTTWAEWAARHPNTTVLALDTGVLRNYDPGAAIAEDLAAAGPLFPTPLPSADGAPKPPKMRVIGVQVGDAVKAYPLDVAESFGVLHDTVGGQDIVLLSRGPGLGVSVYREHEITIDHISGPSDALEAVDTEGNRWFLDEEKLVNVIDSRLRRALPVKIAYWFAWADAYPQTQLLGEN